jgi:hypothetical protein
MVMSLFPLSKEAKTWVSWNPTPTHPTPNQLCSHVVLITYSTKRQEPSLDSDRKCFLFPRIICRHYEMHSHPILNKVKADSLGVWFQTHLTKVKTKFLFIQDSIDYLSCQAKLRKQPVQTGFEHADRVSTKCHFLNVPPLSLCSTDSLISYSYYHVIELLTQENSWKGIVADPTAGT